MSDEFLSPTSKKFPKQFFFTFLVLTILALVGGIYMGSLM